MIGAVGKEPSIVPLIFRYLAALWVFLTASDVI